MEMRAKKIGSSARQSTGIINGQVVRGCIRIQPESAPANLSCVARLNANRKRLILNLRPARLCLVVPCRSGGREGTTRAKICAAALALPARILTLPRTAAVLKASRSI